MLATDHDINDINNNINNRDEVATVSSSKR